LSRWAELEIAEVLEGILGDFSDERSFAGHISKRGLVRQSLRTCVPECSKSRASVSVPSERVSNLKWLHGYHPAKVSG
jgi:hypothetical protein